MTNEYFEELLEEIMMKIENGPGSHIEVLTQIAGDHYCHDKVALKKLNKVIDELNDSMGAVRIIVQYLMFDIEATRRERDRLRMILEDKED